MHSFAGALGERNATVGLVYECGEVHTQRYRK
jgi:hypothetical protein